jgi:lipopolysaccharide transport system permease protein
LDEHEAKPVPTLRIEPSKGWVSLKLHELWEYRELLFFLIRHGR